MSLKQTQRKRLKKLVDNDTAVIEDRRSQSRVFVRMMATVILKNESDQRMRSHSVCAEVLNVSKKGAMIAASEPLESNMIFVRFLIDGAGPNVILSQVVRSEIDHQKSNPFRYGIEFHRLLSDDQFADILEANKVDQAVLA